MTRVIRPVAFQASQLVSTNATEAYSAWSSGTTYATGAIVVYANHLWESLQNSNLNKQPDTSFDWWVDIGPSNQTAMFDAQVSTATTRATPLSVTVKPGVATNSVAFFGLTGNSISVSMKESASGPTVYNKTFSLDDTPIVDWESYFFEPYDFRTELVLTDLPLYGDCEISASVSAASGTVACGTMLYGTVFALGESLNGASTGIRDYSKKETDDFGNTTFVVRAFSKRMDVQVFIEQRRLNFVQKLLSDLRATPCVWIASERAELSPLTVFGFFRDFSIDIQYHDFSMCRLEIEGLT
jgi:hypothetical protein